LPRNAEVEVSNWASGLDDAEIALAAILRATDRARTALLG
jgi:hypothetical protein